MLNTVPDTGYALDRELPFHFSQECYEGPGKG